MGNSVFEKISLFLLYFVLISINIFQIACGSICYFNIIFSIFILSFPTAGLIIGNISKKRSKTSNNDKYKTNRKLKFDDSYEIYDANKSDNLLDNNKDKNSEVDKDNSLIESKGNHGLTTKQIFIKLIFLVLFVVVAGVCLYFSNYFSNGLTLVQANVLNQNKEKIITESHYEKGWLVVDDYYYANMLIEYEYNGELKTQEIVFTSKKECHNKSFGVYIDNEGNYVRPASIVQVFKVGFWCCLGLALLVLLSFILKTDFILSNVSYFFIFSGFGLGLAVAGISTFENFIYNDFIMLPIIFLFLGINMFFSDLLKQNRCIDKLD